MKKLKHITELCEEAYDKGGQSAVYDLIAKQSPTIQMQITWKVCKPCECKNPFFGGSCLVCGS